MCAIAKCDGIWVAVHGINKRILAVGGKGKAGKKRAWKEARVRQIEYGPPGRIPKVEGKCQPMLKKGPAARRIRKELACIERGKRTSVCLTEPEPKLKK